MIDKDMPNIQLEEPTEIHKESVLDYRNEFTANKEVLHGSGGLDRIETFKDWIQKIRNDKNRESVSPNRVPATLFLAVRKFDGKIVGMLQVRHELNDQLLNNGGHIGYSVRKSERRKGYATKMLSDALTYCRSLNIERVLLTCEKDNVVSAAVIKANGGDLENEIFDKTGTKVLRYWISLS